MANQLRDGQKFGIRTDSLNASHSFKYFGSGKGVAQLWFVSINGRKLWWLHT